jgi:DNA-binding CsgD family transcriptional regulator
MPEPLAGGLDLAVEINRVTASASDPTCQLDALWKPLSRIVPFAAAWIGLFDADRRRYVTATAVDHNETNRSFLESTEFSDQVESFGLFERRRAMCLRDVPLPPTELPSWAEHWLPAGYREGLGVPLITRDGRQLGLMTLYTESAADPSDAARDVIETVAPMITAAIDPLSTIAGLAGLVADAQASGVVSRCGAVHPLPGMPSHPLLRTDSRVVPIALMKLTNRRTHTAFLCPWADDDGHDGYVRVTSVACLPRAPHYFTALVLVSPPGDLHGLTRRELEVLGLLVDGRANHHIATTLFITERTVAAHLEHIRTKLNASTRTVAAVRSLRQALYIPHELIGSAHEEDRGHDAPCCGTSPAVSSRVLSS